MNTRVPEILAWIEIEKEMRELSKELRKAHERALRAKLPGWNLRKATKNDIKEGQIIWYPEQKDPLSRYNIPSYWKRVDEVLNTSSEFKAFIAEDGCRYGLNNAFVEE